VAYIDVLCMGMTTYYVVQTFKCLDTDRFLRSISTRVISANHLSPYFEQYSVFLTLSPA